MSISVRTRSRRRESVSAPAAMKFFALPTKSFSWPTKKSGNDIVVLSQFSDQTVKWIIWNLIDILYQGYCCPEIRRFAITEVC